MKNRNSSAEGEEGEIEDSVSETVQVSDSLTLSALTVKVNGRAACKTGQT